MKNIQTIFCLLFFTFILAACNIQTVEQYEQMENNEKSVSERQHSQETIDELNLQEEQISVDVEKPNKVEQVVPPKDEELTEEIEIKKEQQPKQEATKAIEKSEKSVQEPVKKQSEKQSPKEEVKRPNSSSNPTPELKQPLQTEEPQKRYVTITIRVDALLKNWDLLNASLQNEKYVPKSGVVLKTTKYELLTEKETVWDVLKRATREHKIQLEYEGANENTYNSVYIEGINHLYEFSAGPLSGWMYKVNGTYPNYGCSQYVLEDGDVIEWDYTTDLGRDLGQSVAGES